MAGTSFLKAGDAGKLRFGAKIVNLVGDRTQPGGLATTGFDDEGVKAERWHLVRDGMFVDWQTTRELAPLVGQQRSHGCLHADNWSSVPFPRMPNVSLEPAATEVTLDELFSDIKRGLFIEGRGSSSIDQQRYNFQFGGAVIREITQRQARRDGAGRGVSVADAGLLGVVRRPRRAGDVSAVGHVGRRQGGAGPDQRREPRLSAGAVPANHRAEHGGRCDADPRRSAEDLRDRAGARQERRAPRMPPSRCRARSNRTRASPTTASPPAAAPRTSTSRPRSGSAGAAARRPATTPAPTR